jgi:hypothetical protein
VKNAARIRTALFACGIAGLTLSLSLVIASFLRHVDTTDYFKQADEARPWISWGFDTAAAGFVLSFFGRRWWRAVTVALCLLLLTFWFMQMESLL